MMYQYKGQFRQKNIILNLAAQFSTQKAQLKASHLTVLY